MEEFQLINQDGTKEITSPGKDCSSNCCRQEPLAVLKAVGESWRRNHILEQCNDIYQCKEGHYNLVVIDLAHTTLTS
jgi:hypothetical protein